MSWDDGLLEDQKKAAAHKGTHARILAGPGTGKTLTLTRHICFLVAHTGIDPNRILAFTFTRAAARELAQRVAHELGSDQSPRISTLHSFALRQLIQNEAVITALPKPLRIADDWEERNIVLEDLKDLMELDRLTGARELLNQLSADWQTLTADDEDWEKRFPDAKFLGAWREHRGLYGYTLRSELVYQLKKALEQRADFQLESPIDHLLVDEYQDLNRCDLAVVEHIESRGVELFIAGDDDQSIYGFRKAHPEGIRRFPDDYTHTLTIELEVCKRCDEDILDIGLFVAQQDPRRVEKAIRTESGTAKGEVALLRFDEQYSEAQGIADLCQALVSQQGLNPSDILILLRADRNGIFSNQIRQKFENTGIPISASTEAGGPFDTSSGRSFLAFLRLAHSRNDSLAWRSLFHTWCEGVGPGATKAIYELARQRGENFAQTVIAAYGEPDILPSNHRSRLTTAISNVITRLDSLFPTETLEQCQTFGDLLEGVLLPAATSLIADPSEREAVVDKLRNTVSASQTGSIEGLIRAISVASDDIEQEIDDDKVNILTMHRAKGLTAEAVIIAAAEDEYIPGRAQGEEIDDERRLLYVSLTRATHNLFVTYCDKRFGQQTHTGRNSGDTSRSLTQFLADCPHTPRDGKTYISAFSHADNS